MLPSPDSGELDSERRRPSTRVDVHGFVECQHDPYGYALAAFPDAGPRSASFRHSVRRSSPLCQNR